MVGETNASIFQNAWPDPDLRHLHASKKQPAGRPDGRASPQADRRGIAPPPFYKPLHFTIDSIQFSVMADLHDPIVLAYSPFYDIIYINIFGFFAGHGYVDPDRFPGMSALRVLRSGIRHEISHWRYTGLGVEAQKEVFDALRRDMADDILEAIYRVLKPAWSGSFVGSVYVDYFLVNSLEELVSRKINHSKVLFEIRGVPLGLHGFHSVEVLRLSKGELLNLHALVDELLAIHHEGKDSIEEPLIAQLFGKHFRLDDFVSADTVKILNRYGLWKIRNSIVDHVFAEIRKDSAYDDLLSMYARKAHTSA